MISSTKEQTENFKELNNILGWGINEDSIPEVPYFEPNSHTEALQLCVQFLKSEKYDVEYNFNRHIQAIEFQLHRRNCNFSLAISLKADDHHLKQAINNPTNAELYWVGFDYYANLRLDTDSSIHEILYNDTRQNLAGTEILDAMMLSPNIMISIDSKELPACYLGGYRVIYPELPNHILDWSPIYWRYTPCAIWLPDDNELRLDCSYEDFNGGWWTLPTRRLL